jgi:parallel beta-helix repeat protein
MKKGDLKKIISVGIILLFAGTCIIPAFAQDTDKLLPISRGNWLYVGGNGPGNYTKIQDAINASSDGDKVFVYDDSSPYRENLIVNKSIMLIGEKRDTTIIDGEKKDDVIRVTSDQVTITDFTIQNCSFEWSFYRPIAHCGINITSNNNTIKHNLLTNNFIGILFQRSSYNIIFENVFHKNYHPDSVAGSGLILYNFSHHNIVADNRFTNNEMACRIVCNSTNNHIIRNTFIENEFNIDLWLNCSNNIIARNTIHNVSYEGIVISGCCNNTICCNVLKMGRIKSVWSSNNVISGNIVATIILPYSWENQIYRNIILGYNGITAQSNRNNTWDDGKVGNYWGDYRDCFPYAIRSFPRFWIWNIPYQIFGIGNNVDRYPIVGTPLIVLQFIKEILYQLGERG